MTTSSLIVRHIKISKLVRRTLGRVVYTPASFEDRKYSFLAIVEGNAIPDSESIQGHKAILLDSDIDGYLPIPDNIPIVSGFHELKTISSESIILIDPKSHSAHIVFRPESRHNVLFLTNQCNSRCLMCSQPPTVEDDCWLYDENREIVELIREPPEILGISGGEPTLLGNKLFELISSLTARLPYTHFHMLTNGRAFAYRDFADKFATVSRSLFVLEIPLYAHSPDVHDYIVQAKGAFDQTILGLYNLARHNQYMRIRVVLQKETIFILKDLIEYIYRNLPFVSEIVLMGLEPMGYVKKNWEKVWIDPVDYHDSLIDAVRFGKLRGISMSIYNLPLCLLPSDLWPIAKQSISDHKNIFLPECEPCAGKNYCSGLFASDLKCHSRGIHSINFDENSNLFFPRQ